MTPELQARYDALDADKQACILPMITDLLTTVECHGAAILLADPRANGRAAMLSVGDVHFVSQLLCNGAEAYATVFEHSLGITRQ